MRWLHLRRALFVTCHDAGEWAQRSYLALEVYANFEDEVRGSAQPSLVAIPQAPGRGHPGPVQSLLMRGRRPAHECT